MIIKGVSCAGAYRLTAHLSRRDTNERVEVKEVRGVTADNLRGALREMEAVAAGARTTKPFYHASINTRADERLTDEQRSHAIDRLEEKLGLTGQPRVVVVHEKHGREHCHIVWSRIDLSRMAAISDSHNYRKHEEVARQLEREFGHARVQGAHAERDGVARPNRTPSHGEMLQAQRTGVTPQEAKRVLTSAWRHTTTGQEFREALWAQGWQLVRGNRRDFVALDPEGGIHSVARRIQGARAADLRQRWSDLQPSTLPTIRQAGRGQNGPHARPHKYLITRTPSQRVAPNPAGRPATAPRALRPGRPAGGIVAGLADGLFKALIGEASTPTAKPKVPTPQPDSEAQRRQELMRQLSREVTPETQRDAEIELDRGRERRRG